MNAQVRAWKAATLHGEPLARSLDRFRKLVADFIAGRITGQQLQTQFFDMSKGDQVIRPPDVVDAMGSFLYAVEEYVSDPELRAQAGGFDEDEVRRRGRETLAELDRVLATDP